MTTRTPKGETPNIEWLRLTPKQTRVLLAAWTADSIVCKGRELNSAHRLVRRRLLQFIKPIEGGLKGEFCLDDEALAFPPTGLKSLLVHHQGSIEVLSRSEAHAALSQQAPE